MNTHHSTNYSAIIWRTLWAGGLLLIALITLFYSGLPVDGSSGDLQSFTSQGFLVKSIIEEHENGLKVGDIITHIEGHTIEEWLHGSPYSPKEKVQYDILRDGKEQKLEIELSKIPISKIFDTWIFSLFAFLGYITVGTVVIWKRPQDPAARWLMLLTVISTMQGWIDIYNFQPATLLWGWPFWAHVVLEQVSYSFTYATILLFILSFPRTNKWLQRFPRVLPAGILSMGIMTMLLVMVISYPSSTTRLLALGDSAIVYPAMLHFALAIGIAFHATIVERDPIARAQIHWILFGSSLAILIAFAGYGIPLALTGTPLVSRKMMFVFSGTAPIAFAVAILRYRLFDIDIIINRTLVYGVLTALLSGAYLLLVRLLTVAAQTLFADDSQDIVIFISTLTIALAFQPLLKYIQTLINRAFYRNKINYRELLPEMIAQLSRNIILEQLINILTVKLPQKLQISEASIQIFDTDKYDEKNQKTTLGFREGELNIPLVIGKYGTEKKDTIRFIGEYHLGKKLSGTLYTKEEINLLTTLGQQVAVSIENARLYQEIERHSFTLEQKIQERTQELAKAKNSAENATSVLQKVMNNIDAFIYVGDIETGEILFINQPMLEEYGDIRGQICWQALYKNKSKACHSCSNHLLLTDTGNSTGAHHQEILDTLTKRWYSVMSSAIQWVDGRTVRLATRQDITESKEAQIALEESEERLALSINVSNSGLWDFNPHTFSDTHLSDGWFSMLGYGPNELPQNADVWSNLVHPAQLDAVFQAIQDHVEGKAPYDINFQMKTKEGGYRWIHSVGKVVEWDENGHPNRMIGLHFDIDKRIKTEELLRKHEHETTREKERRKLARDLHDTLTQSLHSLVMMADTSQRLLKKERFENLPDSMKLLSDSARQALSETRLLLHELQLSENKEIDLQETLSTRLRIVEQRIGIKTKLEIDGQNYLSPILKNEIFYIAVEALNNAIRHSHAEQILVIIKATHREVELLVKDNGRGFNTKPLGERGMGLENMHYRTKNIGGILHIDSSPKTGTEVRLNVDLQD